MVDMTNDVARFEAMFANRFTDKDEKFIELKSKPLPNPVVIHPWKAQRKVWNKRWDYSSHRNNEERGGNRHRGEGNSRSNYRDRSYDRDRPRDKYDEDRERDRDRNRRDRQYDYTAALKSYSQR